MFPTENKAKQMREKFRNFFNRHLSLSQVLLSLLFFRPWTHSSHQSFWISEITCIPQSVCPHWTLHQNKATISNPRSSAEKCCSDWLESKPDGIAVRSYFFFVLVCGRELELESIRGKQWGRGNEFSFFFCSMCRGVQRFQKITLIGSP